MVAGAFTEPATNALATANTHVIIRVTRVSVLAVTGRCCALSYGVLSVGASAVLTRLIGVETALQVARGAEIYFVSIIVSIE